MNDIITNELNALNCAPDILYIDNSAVEEKSYVKYLETSNQEKKILRVRVSIFSCIQNEFGEGK